MSKSFKIILSIVLLALVAVMIIIFSGSKIYTDLLWFKNLGYLHSFLVMFLSNFWIRLIIGVVFTLFLFANLLITKKVFLNFINVRDDDNVESLFRGKNENLFKWINNKRLTIIYLVGSIILGFMFSSIGQNVWKIVLKYFNRSSFGTVDPIFNQDVGFYVFSLPFFNFIKELSMVVVILTLVVVGIIYILASGINSFTEMGLKLSNRAKSHMTVLVSIFLFLKAWDYRLSMYDLLYSGRGVVFGASYTDVHANLLGLRILFVIAIAIGLAVLVSLFRKNYRIILYGLGIWLLISFIFGSVYPGFVQQYQVEPNEIAKESRYINYNIDMTLKAYGLNDITVKDFNVNNKLTAQDLDNNEDVLTNLRIWDPRPLLSTYSQLQELRQYYNFVNVDVDRYNINGKERQVMISGRELDQTLLPAQAQSSWINKALKYTHGFGLVMNSANEITSEGLPNFYIKDIPPKVNVDLKLDNSSIYYGEKTNNYVISNTDAKEFHYPKGSENVYINYQGNGGVQLNNFFKKVLYAIRFKNLKFLLAGSINPESRVMYYRNIKNRVRRVAPFLEFDKNPYLVLAQGRLFWIQDAYTTTNRYPYSQPVNNMTNYIRNSVKIVVDAYNGSMKFYVVDDSDPLVKTYQKIFPEIFISGDKMPDAFRQHLRYPEDMFTIQSQVYSTYHMKDPTVFYNKEDMWNIPNENYAGNTIQMNPYYIINKLPGQKEPEFMLMLPFTPATKNNMIAWMAARSDPENYGDLFVYNFPKDTLVYGPMQIESRIDQDSEISQLLTLWSQRGSRVIRGNLLVIPVAQSVLYVEPIYLQAETSQLPELKRVVVAYKDNVVMTETLKQGLAQIFGKSTEKVKKTREPSAKQRVLPKTIDELTQRAVDVYNQAKNSLKQGNWSKYGELLNQLEDILNNLNKYSKGEEVK